MSKTTLVSEMLKFHFGNRIVYADGEEGYLVYVIFDPVSRRLTHVGVRHNRLFGKTIHIPFTTRGKGCYLRSEDNCREYKLWRYRYVDAHSSASREC